MNRKMVWVTALFLSGVFPSLAWGSTVLHNVRIGLHPTHTRLVLDCEGDPPMEVYHRTGREWMVCFQALENPQDRKVLPQKPRGKIQKVQWISEGSQPCLKVSLKENLSEAKIFTLQDNLRPQNGIHLVIDFGIPGVSQWRFQKEGSTSTPASDGGQDIQNTLVSSGTPSNRPVVGHPETQETSPPLKQETAFELPTSGSFHDSRASSTKIVRSIQAQSPYELAEMTYEELKNGLPHTAEPIIAAYHRAIQKEPQNPRLSLALLRMAQTWDAIGEVIKAERYYQRLIDEHPRDEHTALAWIRMGEFHTGRGNFIEALKAFQEALKFPLKSPEMQRAKYGAAQVYVQAGKPAEGLDALKRLLSEHPDAYIQKPEIYRTMGEAAFALKDFASSRSYLLRYVNLASDIPDKDIVLARIAETYLQEGQRTQAEKLYAYIEVHYPDSEGDLIGQLRKAEYYETQNPELQDEAFKIYKDLEFRPLAGPLKHFVQFKLAYADYVAGRYEKCLERIDAILKTAEKVPVNDDIRVLRQKVLHSLVKKRFDAGDARGVVDLYSEDPFAFQDQEGLEALACVAQAYESLGLYPEARPLYETLAQKELKPKWTLAVARMAYEMGELEKAHSLCLTVNDAALLDVKEHLLVRIAFAKKDYPSVIRYGEALTKRLGGAERCPHEVAAMVALSLFETGKEETAMQWAEACFPRSDWEEPSLLVALSLKGSRYRQKNRMYDQAVQLLDRGIEKVQSEDLRNQLTYEKATVLLEQGKKEQAEQVLSELLQSSKDLWKTAARQKLDYLKLHPSEPWTPGKDPGAS